MRLINIIIIISWLLLVSCKKNHKEKTAENNDILRLNNPTNVDIVQANVGVFEKEFSVNGRIEAVQKSNLRFNTSNQIINVSAENGQLVERGEIIARLENSLLQAELAAARTKLKKAKNNYDILLIDYGFSLDNSNKPPIEVDNRLKIQSGLREAMNEIQLKNVLFNQTILRAPFTGIIANLDSRTGDYIGPSDIFCTIINPKLMKVVFLVTEDEIRYIKKGSKIKLEDSSSNNKHNGTVTAINPMVNEFGLVEVHSILETSKQNEKLIDGMNVRVIIKQSLEKMILVPKNAVISRSNKDVIFTVDEGRAKWNDIKIYDGNSEYYAVAEGISESDLVIVDGNLHLDHNSFIEIRDTVAVKE